MKRRAIKDTYSRLKEQRREQGFSLVEILIVATLLAIVGVVITAAVLNTTEANDNVSASTITQRELLDTTSAVTRDVSTSTEIIAAGDYHLIMRTNSGDTSQVVSYFFWTPSGKELAASVTDRLEVADVDLGELPDFPAVMEMRENPDGTKILRPLVPGFQDRSDDFQHLFTFYENGGREVMDISRTSGDINGSLEDDRVSAIERVEMRFAAQPAGRDKPMEMATSVTPKSGNQSLGGGPGYVASQPVPAAPFLVATLAEKSDVAEIEWDRVEGASGYTLYRENRLQSLSTVVRTFDRDTIRTTDSDIIWGETYSYYVVAHGAGGNSATSNISTVVAVPPAAELSGSASDRTNRISWEHVNGVGPLGTPANAPGTGYKLYRIADNGTQSLIYTGVATSYNDTGRNFGDRTQYYIVPFNRGGDGWDSEKITLYTRPPANTIQVNIPAKSSTARVTWSEAKNALNGYTVHRANRNENTRQVGSTRHKTHSYNDSANLKWGERYSYHVYSSNSGGQSNISNVAHAYLVPPAPRASGNANGTNNTITWNEVNGVNTQAEPRGDSASGYKLYRVGTSSPIYQGHNRSFVDRNRPYGSSASYYVVPYNRGGDGFESNRITLVSPPTTPTVTVRDYTNGNDGFNRVSWNKPSGTKYFRYQRGGGSISDQGSRTSLDDTSPGRDSRHTYKVQACNDAGCSPSWGSAVGLQPPGPFSVSSSSQKKGDHTWLLGARGAAASPRSNNPEITVVWGTSAGANSYSAKRGSWTRSNSTSRTLIQGGLASNEVYTYTVTAHGNTSNLGRSQNIRVQTAPELPREVRGSWNSRGGSRELTTARFTLHNGKIGHGKGGNGYRVEVNSTIAHGSGNERDDRVRLSGKSGWKRWNNGSSITSQEWASRRSSSSGYGAMIFIAGRSNLQSGAVLPSEPNNSSWPSMYRTNGNISMITSFSMRTYGQGWGGRVGNIPQNYSYGHYQNTCSTRGYYQIMNGGSAPSSIPGC